MHLVQEGNIAMKVRNLVFLAIIGVSVLCYAYPKPAIVPDAKEWTLDVVFDEPQQINVKVPGHARKERFWYIILTLTNNSGSDVPFYPSCDLYTDTFQVVPAGIKTQQLVFKQIKLKHQGKYPFLESIDFVDDRILQGEDNARDIVIIWRDFDEKAKNINLFIAGLSNETVVVEHPTETDENGDPIRIYLRKTLALKYAIGGDESLRHAAKLLFKDRTWVMR